MHSTIDTLSQRLPGFEGWDTGPFMLFAIAYFVPVLIALGRKHRFTMAIGSMNVFLGWTGIGWLAALIWAVNRDVPEIIPEAAQPAETHELREPSLHYFVDSEDTEVQRVKPCPWCAEEIKQAAIVCHYCNREVVAPASGAPRDLVPAAAYAAPNLRITPRPEIPLREAGAKAVARRSVKPKVRWLSNT